MSIPSRNPRPYDLVLFGATGFTGRLVAEYLAQSRPQGLSWALAGRSSQKLERLAAELAANSPGLDRPPVLVGDSDDQPSLARIAEQAAVVCTTVGPYLRYGRGLVAACAQSGTDYCDLTGEVPFIRDSIDRFDATAQKTGARIVHCCGFDSLPSDLGVHLLHEHFLARGKRLAAARSYLVKLKGGISGGTLASMLGLAAMARRDPEVRRLMLDPYALYPDRQADRGPERLETPVVKWDAEAQYWTAPFLMALVNGPVVRRTNALRGFAYGRDFRYGEVMGFRRGPAGLAKAALLTAGVGGLMAASTIDGVRELFAKLLPGPGEGPSDKALSQGCFRVQIIGHSAPDDAGRSERATARIEDDREPGYVATARMLAEAAICLAKDPREGRGGVLTPAVAMGSRLIERLRKIGMVWEVSP